MRISRTALAMLVMSLALSPVGGLVEAEAQQGQVHRIAVLSAGIRIPAGQGPGMPAFDQALRERGWVPGKDLSVTYRFAEEKYDRLPSFAAELVRLDPQVIVTVSMAATRAAKDATDTIPIVMWGVANPIGEGLVPSFARPGGNVTGYTGTTPFEAFPKLMQLLKEAVPHAKRMAFLWNPANPAAQPAVKVVQDAARRLGVELRVVGARVPEEFEPAFRSLAQPRTDALFIYGDVAYVGYRRQLADLALRERLPTISHDDGYAQVGGLMTYSVDPRETVRRVAGYVDRILHGAKPTELPVEQPTRFDLTLNLKTAKTLGLSIPSSLRLQAERVIE